MSWGPALWCLLHSAAERFGSKPGGLPDEERRIWLQLLHALRFSLPCPQCKTHYQVYHGRHPLPGGFGRDVLRTWLYRLHSEVNQRLGKPDLALSEVEVAYGQPFCFSAQVERVREGMRGAIQRGACVREDVGRALRVMEEMRRYYDFF
jgi:hypothetical protein